MTDDVARLVAELVEFVDRYGNWRTLARDVAEICDDASLTPETRARQVTAVVDEYMASLQSRLALARLAERARARAERTGETPEVHAVRVQVWGELLRRRPHRPLNTDPHDQVH